MCLEQTVKFAYMAPRLACFALRVQDTRFRLTMAALLLGHGLHPSIHLLHPSIFSTREQPCASFNLLRFPAVSHDGAQWSGDPTYLR